MLLITHSLGPFDHVNNQQSTITFSVYLQNTVYITIDCGRRFGRVSGRGMSTFHIASSPALQHSFPKSLYCKSDSIFYFLYSILGSNHTISPFKQNPPLFFVMAQQQMVYFYYIVYPIHGRDRWRGVRHNICRHNESKVKERKPADEKKQQHTRI